MKMWLAGVTLLLGVNVASAFAGYIDFENGFTDQDRLYSVATGDNTVSFSTYTAADRFYRNYAYIARSGGIETAYSPADNVPAGAGEYFVTDEFDGPSASLNYRFDFATGIHSFGVDLYDYRADGGPAAGDTVSLYLYDANNGVIGSQTRTILSGLPDPNLFSFDIDVGSLIARSAYLDFGHTDVGTGIDNLRFTSVPEPGTYALFGLGLLGLAYARHQMQ